VRDIEKELEIGALGMLTEKVVEKELHVAPAGII
jgi:hypothetical protein